MGDTNYLLTGMILQVRSNDSLFGKGLSLPGVWSSKYIHIDTTIRLGRLGSMTTLSNSSTKGIYCISIYYKILKIWMFRPFWIGFPHCSLPFCAGYVGGDRSRNKWPKIKLQGFYLRLKCLTSPTAAKDAETCRCPLFFSWLHNGTRRSSGTAGSVLSARSWWWGWGSRGRLDTWLITMVKFLVPLRIKLSNPFQMAELHLCMACTVNGGGILTTYKSWDDPPSKPLINRECWMLHRR